MGSLSMVAVRSLGGFGAVAPAGPSPVDVIGAGKYAAMSGTSCSVSSPMGAAAGDLIVAFTNDYDKRNGTVAASGLTFDLLHTYSPASAQPWMRVWAAVMPDATQRTVTWTTGASTVGGLGVVALRGVDTTDPLDFAPFSGGYGGNPTTLPDVATNDDGSAVLWWVVDGQNADSYVSAASAADGWVSLISGQSNRKSTLAMKSMPSAGAAGQLVVTKPGTLTWQAAACIAFRAG